MAAAARELGLGRPRLANWISDGHAPPDALEALARKLGVTLEQLAEDGASAEIVELQRAVGELDEQIRAVRRAVRKLV